jgi:hypothetical protein
MLLEDFKQLKTGRRELRSFGLLVGGVFLALGLLFLWREKPYYPWFIIPGVALIIPGFLFPKTLKPVYLLWMTLALALGFVVSHVILTVFFFLVITPVGLLARVAGKDFLRLKLDRQTPSYWIPREQRPATPERYERQF